MRPRLRPAGLVVGLGLSFVATAVPARAQPPAPNAAPPSVPPPAAATPPPAAGAGGSGVIRPPAGVDPGIDRGPPPAGTQGADPMPVYRPPGTPGGNPNVVPK